MLSNDSPLCSQALHVLGVDQAIGFFTFVAATIMIAVPIYCAVERIVRFEPRSLSGLLYARDPMTYGTQSLAHRCWAPLSRCLLATFKTQVRNATRAPRGCR